ncbi:OLC1v1017372C1 [Oldenlandia corymbosa var. corymbosa]|uniref:OLC1v1017372C1 n=1 Tax=Oldenlandia corymbosa var. corymbosa TaxID=529605 RepID=A0AAV1E999_OLDCO|nr:OLC1v1017372C1 [Oldenlandia corymbosa var. corymbosa]
MNGPTLKNSFSFFTINTHFLITIFHHHPDFYLNLPSQSSPDIYIALPKNIKMATFASISSSNFVFKLFLLVSLINVSLASRMLLSETSTQSPKDQFQLLEYHNGALLTGKTSVNLIWYGKFKPSQRAIVADFISSLSSSSSNTQAPPSVASWWKTTEKYYRLANSKKPSSLSLNLGKQILDENYSLGKSLSQKQIVQLASKGEQRNAINIVLTASDVTFDGFCRNKCGFHGSSRGAVIKGKTYKFAYIVVGNSETQCPGYCAWPFHQPQYGPQTPPLIAPNNDVGMDGVVINLASLMAGTATNPFGNGYYQGPAEAPLEASSACPGVYAKGAYPGYPGDLLVDPTTGASYNAHGTNGRKFVLPAFYDPSTTSCSTLV